MTQFRYLSSITTEELEENSVIPCVDEDNYSCILIKNLKAKTIQSGYSTDNLDVKLNRVLIRDDAEYYFHIIKAKSTDAYSKNQFNTIFDYVFKKIEHPINDTELASLITSLEDFFKITPERNLRDIQIGVFGELMVIKYLCNIGYENIVKKYHTNFYSKHDIEISNKLRMEIKTTTSERRIHHFKHNQISRSDVSVVIASVMLEESKEGLSLKELFNQVKLLFVDPDALFALKKLEIRCGLSEENEGMSFSEEKCFQMMRFINSEDAPKIKQEIFDGVTNIEYDVDLSTCHYYINEDLLNILNER